VVGKNKVIKYLITANTCATNPRLSAEPSDGKWYEKQAFQTQEKRKLKILQNIQRRNSQEDREKSNVILV
jgi:hypothetical protein